MATVNEFVKATVNLSQALKAFENLAREHGKIRPDWTHAADRFQDLRKTFDEALIDIFNENLINQLIK